MILNIALSLFALLAVVWIAMLWRRKQAETHREAFEALAARRGWSLRITNQSLGRPSLLRLSSRGGAQWTSHMADTTGPFSWPAQSHVTDFAGDEPRWSEGYVFIGPAPPTSEDTALSPEQAEAWVRKRVIGDGMGADLSGLAPQDAPDTLTVLATTAPHLRVDLADLAKLWKSWESFDPAGHDKPTILLSPDGLRLRLWHGARTAEQLEQVIDFALSVSRTIGNR